MSVKGLLFDFNGTLFFDSEFHVQAFIKCFEKYGIPTPDRTAMVNKIFGRSNRDIYLSCFDPNGTEAEIREFELLKEQLYMDICLENPRDFKLCDGAVELLDFLKKQNVPYCIATGSPRENVEFYFKHLELGKWFTYGNLVYTDGTFKGKPAPDCYILAAKRLGLLPSECAVFEDGTSGIKAARAAGADKVIAVWERGLPSPLTDSVCADEEHHDLSDWKGILSRLGLVIAER